MTTKYDFDTVFQLLDQMEDCLNRVRDLNNKLNEAEDGIKKAA